MNKKVLLLANEYTTILDFRMELIKSLLEEGYQVFVVLPEDVNNIYIENLGCTIITISMSKQGRNPIEDYITLREIDAIMKKVKPDVVLTFTIKPNIYGGIVCQKRKIPYIANITGLGRAIENSGYLQKFTLFLYKKGLKRATTVLCQNIDNLNFLKSHRIVSGRIDLIPGSGVNVEKYQILKYPNPRVIHFAYIARIMKEKGIEQYLDLAKNIKKKYPDTIFHVCGTCEPEYKQIMQEMNDKGLITFHGQVSSIIDIYRIVHCVVHPSFYPEGLSNVLLEASACGRPIITTDRPGCREVIDDGINGFIVQQRNSQDLIEKVEKFLLLSWESMKTMGLNGRKKVEIDYNRQIVVNKYLDEIKEAVSK